MKRRWLLLYQLLTGFSDTGTGIMLVFFPGLTLKLMHVNVAAAALPFVSYIGVFVLAVGLACFYGGWLLYRNTQSNEKMETIWALTALTRGLVAAFVTAMLLRGVFEIGWITVPITDSCCALLQFTGLARGWLYARER